MDFQRAVFSMLQICQKQKDRKLLAPCTIFNKSESLLWATWFICLYFISSQFTEAICFYWIWYKEPGVFCLSVFGRPVNNTVPLSKIPLVSITVRLCCTWCYPGVEQDYKCNMWMHLCMQKINWAMQNSVAYLQFMHHFALLLLSAGLLSSWRDVLLYWGTRTDRPSHQGIIQLWNYSFYCLFWLPFSFITPT